MPSISFSFEEDKNSRSSSENPVKYGIRYIALGEFDDQVVRANAYSLTYPQVAYAGQLLNRTNINVVPNGHKNYFVDVEYSQKNNEVGSSQFSFDTTGATINIKVAKEHIDDFPAYYSSPTDYRGSIGVKQDGTIEGVDIIIPALRLTYTYKHPFGVVNEEFARNMARATGRTNLDTFRGFEPCELLFMGASGSDGSTTDAEVTYSFIASQNADDLTVGEITGIVKKGHHVAWVEFEDSIDDNAKDATRPACVYIERVYDEINFASTFGWS